MILHIMHTLSIKPILAQCMCCALVASFVYTNSPVFAAENLANNIISQATGGQMNAAKGSYFENTCNQQLDYDAQVIDLNNDGQAEVFTQTYGACMGGMAGVHVNLYIKNTAKKWQPQFGFPGVYRVLKTKYKNYPDIAIDGPGTCSPIWRWNGQQYELFKKCPI